MLPTPMHYRNHEVGAILTARTANIEDDLLILAPGATRFVGISLKTAWKKFVISKKGHPQTMAFDDQRHMRLGQITPAAKIRNARALQPIEHLRKGQRAKIAGVVVG